MNLTIRICAVAAFALIISVPITAHAGGFNERLDSASQDEALEDAGGAIVAIDDLSPGLDVSSMTSSRLSSLEDLTVD